MSALLEAVRRRVRGSAHARVALLVLATCVAVGLVAQTRAWQYVEDKAFDAVSVAAAPRRSALPITIVGIDEESFAALRVQWPWPRDLHARLLEKLAAADVAVVGIDVLFPEPSREEEDRRFAEAIGRAGNVVLAASVVYRETEQMRQWLRVDPLEQFRRAGAEPGLVSMTLDADAVPRTVPPYRDAFWRRVAEALHKARPGLVAALPEVSGGRIRYLGPDHTFPYVPYHEVLDADPRRVREALRDHIVLVGRDVRASPELGSAQGDTFATPFTLLTGRLTPGVEIHATVLENVLSGSVVLPAPAWAAWALLVLAASLAGVLLRDWRPLRGSLVLAALLVAVAGLSALAFDLASVWLPPAAGMTGALLVFAGTGSLSFLSERRQRRELKLALSRYVAREVVEEIAAHPERLVLGGARRRVTLMFTDLEGFTQLSERLAPEEVAHTLNVHFDGMTTIILRHRGTVDKYIGDAVMAFWGAPVDDDAQAEHACAAARDMQQEMRSIRESLQARGLPGIRMRIGIHSGEAIVGNMGSQIRFNYTAIGDDVNLASRLEGVNKLYGTDVLASGSTVERASGAIAFRRVDRIRVKGKTRPVDVYTLAREGQPVALSDAAIEAYRAQQWDESLRRWDAWLAREPDDTVAQVYRVRIAEFRRAPPGEDWDGSVALEKM